MKFSDTFYNFIKYFVCIVLPAAQAVILGLGEIYGFGWAGTAVNTIALGATFLGAIFCIENAVYSARKGTDGKVSLEAETEEESEA